MTEKSYENEDEIDLSELFATLWYHKIWIAIVTSLSVFFSGYYALNTDKKYTATAIFEIEQNSSNGINLPSEFGALASIAGIGSAVNTSSEILMERILEREFILKVSQNLSLKDDPLFQTYNPQAVDPIWKATIKKLIGWEKVNRNKRYIIDNVIQKNYLKYVEASRTPGGAIKISITHEDPKLAAEYANQIMELIRQTVATEEEKSKEMRLSYLAETLADALQDMEIAQQNIKNYTLENSAAAQENFIVGSLRLDALRLERREAEEFLLVLETLRDLGDLADLDMSAYEALKVRTPLVDDLDFRRIMGMSETISAWSWPTLDTIESVSETLSDRISRLNVDIANIEDSAMSYAASAEDQAKLLRDAKIAEATFTVLTEQVKSQTLVAGFKPETFTVFAYATPPISPSSPKRNFILILGAVLGIFVGSVLSLINGVRRGVFYTRSSVLYAVQAGITLKVNSLRRLARLPTSKLLNALEQREVAVLDEAQVNVADKPVVYVTHSNGKPSASKIGRLIATQSVRSGQNVLLFDLSHTSRKNSGEIAIKEIEGLSIGQSDEGFEQAQDFGGSAFFTSANFGRQMKALLKAYDQIFICSEDEKSNAGLMAIKSLDPAIILVARLRKSKKANIQKIKSIHPVSILFHD
ncbi:MAG: Wzz/FepE/Etk N-terminal domain-containing protein [Pseudomonadota bacterium]|nr:Wzz/FepE/Etk N-terminal domain-containing protein [Pseudomonadota bacterium]